MHRIQFTSFGNLKIEWPSFVIKILNLDQWNLDHFDGHLRMFFHE